MFARQMTKALHRLIPLTLITVATIAVAGCLLPMGEPVARVNGRQITAGQLLEKTMQFHGGDVLLEMIDTRLILQAARRQGLHADASAIEAELERAVSQVGSREDLQKRLEASARTMEDFRKQCRAEVLLDDLARPLIPVDEKTLKQYYQQHKEEFHHGPQVRARWMLFDDKHSAEAIESVLGEPDASFSGLAKAFSSDSVTAPEGGDMGFFEREDYADEVTDVAFSLKPGETSEIFEVPDGWAILQVVEKRPAGSPPFEEIAGQLKARIRAEKMPAARQQWLKQTRQNAELSFNSPDVARQVRALIKTGHPYNPTQFIQVPGPRPQMPMR